MAGGRFGGVNIFRSFFVHGLLSAAIVALMVCALEPTALVTEGLFRLPRPWWRR